MELGAFIACGAAGGPMDHALACLLGLLGLRVSEACSINIEDLGMERGHRTVTVLGKGGKLAVIPLPPRIGRALDLAAVGRLDGPLLLARSGRRLNRHAATWTPVGLVVHIRQDVQGLEDPPVMGQGVAQLCHVPARRQHPDDVMGAHRAGVDRGHEARLGRPDASDEDVRTAARAAQADEFIAGAPDGYDTLAGEFGSRLSGGQRQRIALARALLKDAPILVMDEAVSNLDIESEREVSAAMAAAKAGRTTLVVAHRLSTIRSADRIVVLDHGHIAETGTHDELLDRGGAYTHLLASQISHPGVI